MSYSIVRSRVGNVRGPMPRSGVCSMHIEVGGVPATTSIGTYLMEVRDLLLVNVTIFIEVSLHTSKSDCEYIDESDCLLRVPQMARP